MIQRVNQEKRRLFFGLAIEAPWEGGYPEGRLIAETGRHITLAFLGNIDFLPLQEKLADLPLPSFVVAPVGKTDQVLFLPESTPRVVAHHVHWLSQNQAILSYHQRLLDWLQAQGLKVDRRPLLSHITLARSPFDQAAWRSSFHPLPLFISRIVLYDSPGHLEYVPLWQKELIPPFVELEHTADIAFSLTGQSLRELYLHAAIALSFVFPPFLAFFQEQACEQQEDIVRWLNQMIAACDREMGCPFKAVSYHGAITQQSNQLFHWEMVVDV